MLKRAVFLMSFMICICFITISKSQTNDFLLQQKENIIQHIIDKNYINASSSIDELFKNYYNHPDLSSTLYEIAKKYESFEKHEDALELYEYIVKETSQSPIYENAKMNLSKCAIIVDLRSGNNISAKNRLDTFINDFKESTDISRQLFYIAGRFRKSNDIQTEKYVYEEIINIYPNSPFAERSLLGKTKIEIMNIIQTEPEQAYLKAVHMIETNSGAVSMPDEIHHLARSFEAKRHYLYARNLYQMILDNFGESPFAQIAEFGIARTYLFEIVEQDADINDILFDIDGLISTFGDRSGITETVFKIGETYYYDKGKNLFNEGLIEQAKDNFRCAVKIFKRTYSLPQSKYSPMSIHYKAVCHTHLTEYQNAIEEFEKLVTLYPDYAYNSQALYLTGYYYQQLADDRQIEKDLADIKTKEAYQVLLEKYPNSPSVSIAKRWLNE